MSAKSARSPGFRFVRRSGIGLPVALALLGACSSTIGGGGDDGADPAAGGTSAGSAGTSSGSSNGGSSSGASGAAGTGNNSGASGSTGVGGTGIAGGGPMLQCADQAAVTPGLAPLRRLTIPEYNNTVRAILGETSNPAFEFPSELSGNGFGNDARFQPVSSVLATNHNTAAEAMAARVTGTPAALAAFLPCSSGVTAANQEACVRTFVQSWVPKAYRRPLVQTEIDELVALYTAVQGIVDDDTTTAFAARFASGIAAILEAVLVSPEFMYKPEFGVPDAANPTVKRPTGPEMATRLSYLLWATSPDAELMRAAAAGELATDAGVRTQAERLVADPQARDVVRYFFDNLLPLSNLTDLPREASQYPTFNSMIGGLMREETRTFLDYEVFDPAGSGKWSGILTAPYTFVNGPLAAYYGMPGVTGNAFQRTPVDTTQRLGLLTQGSIMTGLTPSNHTNPVIRGAFIVNLLMCRGIGLPTDPDVLSMVTPPDPFSAPTARERYTKHKSIEICAGCHVQMDPMGFALENFDAVGLWRTTENDVLIDASGDVPDMPGGAFGTCTSGIACSDPPAATACNGSCAGELANRLAQNAEVMTCFPSKWLDYAYGQTLTAQNADDVCNRESLSSKFIASGSNIKQMLVDITQTDGFLYLGAQE